MSFRLTLIFVSAIAVSAIAIPAAAQVPNGVWISDPHTGCKVWDGFYGPGNSITWSGNCVDGYAQGHGVLVWFDNGKLWGTYEGDYLRGKASGQGKILWQTGEWYEGAWQNDEPNGWGTHKTTDGQTFTGTWNNGCFKEGNRWSTAATTAQVCGFK